MDTTADQLISFDELKDYIEQQVGFRSSQTLNSLQKANPEHRTEMHKDLQNS